MIFVTVGSQEPFDRLISAVDEWARLRALSDVFAQIASSTLHPRHIQFTQFVEPPEFSRIMEETRIIVAHAGMGSIISALELGNPSWSCRDGRSFAKLAMTIKSRLPSASGRRAGSSLQWTRMNCRQSSIMP